VSHDTVEASTMKKRTITTAWMWGLVLMAVGGILIPTSALALAAHLGTVTPPQGKYVAPDDYSRTMVILIVLGGIIAGTGMIAQLVAWIGAVVNTNRLADKSWFNALLWSGIVGIVTTPLFGLGALILGSAMIAYLVGGPDAMAVQQPLVTAAGARPPLLTKPTITRWTTWAIIAMVSGTFYSLLVSRATDSGRFLEGHTWPSLALLSLGFTVLAGGVIGLTVAWWGAVFNTSRLADKTWFQLLLWSGIVAVVTSPLFGLGALIGLGVMVAYLRAGPDGLAVQPPQSPQMTTPDGPPPLPTLAAR
jgi:hypothetical protein